MIIDGKPVVTLTMEEKAEQMALKAKPKAMPFYEKVKNTATNKKAKEEEL